LLRAPDDVITSSGASRVHVRPCGVRDAARLVDVCDLLHIRDFPGRLVLPLSNVLRVQHPPSIACQPNRIATRTHASHPSLMLPSEHWVPTRGAA
jgi:hypothetical protein